MVRKFRELASHSQVHHEGRTRKSFGLNFTVGPTRAQLVGNEFLHRMRKICVDHNRVGLVSPLIGFNGRDPLARELKLANRFVQPDRTTQLLGYIGHPTADLTAPANRMVNPILVLEKRKDRKQTRAAKRRHPQILGLKGKRDHKPRILEVLLKLLSKRHPRLDVGYCRHERRAQIVLEGIERALEYRTELGQFHPVVVQVLFQLADVLRR